MKKQLVAYLGIFISIIAVFLILRKINLHSLAEVFKEIHFLWLVPMALVYLSGFLIRGLRWRIMLLPIKPIPFMSTTYYIITGYMANNIFPARLGELVRALIIGKREQISRVSSLGSIGVERVFDGIVLLGFMAITFFLSRLENNSTDTIKKIVIFSGIIFGSAGILIIAARYKRLYFEGFVKKVTKYLPSAISSKLIDINSKLLDALSFLRFDRSLVLLILLSLFVWINEGLVFWIALNAFNLKASFVIAYFTLAFVNLGLILPSGPAFIGVFQGLNILAFSYFGISEEIALGYSIIVHSVMIIPITIWGLLLINKWGINGFSMLKKLKDQEN